MGRGTRDGRGDGWTGGTLVAQIRDYAIFALDPQGVILSWNAGAEAVKGYTPDEIIGQHFSVFYTDDDRRAGLPLQLLDAARRDGRVEHTGWRVRKDGTRFWADVVITALHDDNGAIIGYGKVTRDLTEQHALEESLRHSEERFRTLVSQVRDYAIFALDRHGIIETWNAGAEAVKGYTPDEIIGQHFSVFYTDEDRRAGLPLQLLDEARAFGRVEHTGWRVRKDGTRFWADAIITALYDDQGSLTGYAKVTRDLTDQHDLELQLRENESRFRLLVSQVVDYSIIALDAQGIIQSWNAGAEAVKGYEASEILGKHFSVFYTEDDRRAGLPYRLLEEARLRGRVEHTGWRVRKDGTRFWGDVVITALYDDNGRLTGFGKVTRDLTERMQLDSARDSFFASISHDLKTPLTAIKGFAGLLDTADGARRADIARRLEINADRLSVLVDDLVEYAKLRAGQVPLVWSLVSFGDIVRDSLRNLGPVLSEHQVVFDEEPVEVEADPHVMERVVGNLLSNAVKYSPKGSKVAITLSTALDKARLVVSDQGRGILPEDLPLIFDEFERGKLAQSDGGSGLGLASVKQLVALHGGHVRIESEVGEGTQVTIELPIRQPPGPSPLRPVAELSS